MQLQGQDMELENAAILGVCPEEGAARIMTFAQLVYRSPEQRTQGRCHMLCDMLTFQCSQALSARFGNSFKAVRQNLAYLQLHFFYLDIPM